MASAGDDAAGIEVDDVAHAIGEGGVGGDFDDGRDGIAGGRAEAGGEEHEIRAGARLRSHALDVVARRAEQSEAGCRRVLREVEHVADGSDAALARRTGRLDGVGDESVFDVAGRGIHFETRMHGFGARGVSLHQVEEALGEFVGGAAVDELLLDAVKLGKLAEDGLPPSSPSRSEM